MANPANYQSGGAVHALEFTAAPTATSVQFQYQASTANIQRNTYFLGSQAIATRISGDPNGNNASPEPGRRGLYYIHTDHTSTALSTGLGSTSLMSDSSGVLVANSVAHYLPDGTWRTEPTANASAGSAQALTDRGYTGHKHNDDT